MSKNSDHGYRRYNTIATSFSPLDLLAINIIYPLSRKISPNNMFMAGTDTIIWSFDMHSIVIQPPGGEGKFKFKCIILSLLKF